MAALAVEPDLEVVEYRIGELDAGLPLAPVEQLDLHARPEQLDHGVVVAVPTETIDGTRPDSFARRVKAQEANWTPWSEWIVVVAC